LADKERRQGLAYYNKQAWSAKLQPMSIPVQEASKSQKKAAMKRLFLLQTRQF
jgi:hypothetical protein